MTDDPTCPVCTMPDPLIAPDGWECDTCGHTWQAEPDDGIGEVRDANGALLSEGDDVVVVKDLKLDGKSGGIKIGTKVLHHAELARTVRQLSVDRMSEANPGFSRIRLVPGDHPVQGKVNGRTVLITPDKVKRA